MEKVTVEGAVFVLFLSLEGEGGGVPGSTGEDGRSAGLNAGRRCRGPWWAAGRCATHMHGDAESR